MFAKEARCDPLLEFRLEGQGKWILGGKEKDVNADDTCCQSPNVPGFSLKREKKDKMEKDKTRKEG